MAKISKNTVQTVAPVYVDEYTLVLTEAEAEYVKTVLGNTVNQTGLQVYMALVDAGIPDKKHILSEIYEPGYHKAHRRYKLR